MARTEEVEKGFSLPRRYELVGFCVGMEFSAHITSSHAPHMTSCPLSLLF